MSLSALPPSCWAKVQHTVSSTPQHRFLLVQGPQYSMLLSFVLSILMLAAEPRCSKLLSMFYCIADPLLHWQTTWCWVAVQRNIYAAHVAVLVLLVHHQAAVDDARPLPEGGLIPVGRRSNDHCLAELADCQDLQAPAGGR